MSNRSLVLLFMTSLLAACSSGSSPSSVSRPSPTPLAIIVPFTVDPTDSHALIMIIANGLSMKADLDTGAQVDVIDASLARSMNLQVRQTEPLITPYGLQRGERLSEPLKIALDGFTMTDNMVLIQDKNMHRPGEQNFIPTDMTIGAPVFKDRVITFDYKRHVFKLGPLGLRLSCPRDALFSGRATFNHALPIVQASVNGDRGGLMLDTGSGEAFSVYNAGIAGFGLQQESKLELANQRHQFWVGTDKSISLGRFKVLPDVYFIRQNAPSGIYGRVGAPSFALSGATLSIDYKTGITCIN